jgi:hypothetical protein
MDKEEVWSMKVAKGNKLYANLLKGAKHIPKGYSRTKGWNRPLWEYPLLANDGYG